MKLLFTISDFGLALGAGIFVVLNARGADDVSKLPPPAGGKVEFAKDIQPIFESRCYNCHGPKKQEASLRFDQKAAALKGGESGPVILPGKSAESLLVIAVARIRDDLKMPKKGEALNAE